MRAVLGPALGLSVTFSGLGGWLLCWQRCGWAGDLEPGACVHAVYPLFPIPSPPPPGVSRGPSPVVLGSQDALPVATAFTEYVHAYFRGHSPRYPVMGRQGPLGGLCWGGSSRDSFQMCFMVYLMVKGP